MIYYIDGCARKKYGCLIECVSEKNELSANSSFKSIKKKTIFLKKKKLSFSNLKI